MVRVLVFITSFILLLKKLHILFERRRLINAAMTVSHDKNVYLKHDSVSWSGRAMKWSTQAVVSLGIILLKIYKQDHYHLQIVTLSIQKISS